MKKCSIYKNVHAILCWSRTVFYLSPSLSSAPTIQFASRGLGHPFITSDSQKHEQQQSDELSKHPRVNRSSTWHDCCSWHQAWTYRAWFCLSRVIASPLATLYLIKGTNIGPPPPPLAATGVGRASNCTLCSLSSATNNTNLVRIFKIKCSEKNVLNYSFLLPCVLRTVCCKGLQKSCNSSQDELLCSSDCRCRVGTQCLVSVLPLTA